MGGRAHRDGKKGLPSIAKILDNTPRNTSTHRPPPLIINSCTNDACFPLSASAQADELFGEGKFAPGYEREYFEGAGHGFACRGDMTDSGL